MDEPEGEMDKSLQLKILIPIPLSLIDTSRQKINKDET